MLSKIPEKYRKPVYAALIVLAFVTFGLALAVQVGWLTDSQVVETAQLWLKYGTLGASIFAGFLALRNIKPD